MTALLDAYQHPAGPPCFDTPKQYASWRAAARSCFGLHATSTQPHFCTDCTPEYQNDMKAAQHCVHQAVVFVRLPGEGTVGMRPEEALRHARIEWEKEDRRLSSAVTDARNKAARTQHDDDYNDLQQCRSALFTHRLNRPTAPKE